MFIEKRELVNSLMDYEVVGGFMKNINNKGCLFLEESVLLLHW